MSLKEMRSEHRDFRLPLSSAAADTYTTAYDADSKLIEGVTGRYGNTLSFAYDDTGAVESETQTLGGTAYTITTGRDVLGSVTSITHPDGAIVTQTHSGTHPGRPLSSISFTPSGGSAGQLASFGYDDAGREDTRTQGAGAGAITTTRGYDASGRLTGIDSAIPELDFTYTYDALGSLASETRGGTRSGDSWTASYDADQRLTTWDVSTGDDESWTLSAVGGKGKRGQDSFLGRFDSTERP